MPSFPITSCFNLHLFHPCWALCWGSAGHLLPSIWSRGGEMRCACFCELPPTSLPVVALLLHSRGLQLSPLWVVTTVGTSQYASQKALVPVPHLPPLCGIWNHTATRQIYMTLQAVCIACPQTPRVNTEICAKLCQYIILLILPWDSQGRSPHLVYNEDAVKSWRFPTPNSCSEWTLKPRALVLIIIFKINFLLVLKAMFATESLGKRRKVISWHRVSCC